MNHRCMREILVCMGKEEGIIVVVASFTGKEGRFIGMNRRRKRGKGRFMGMNR